MTSCNSGGLSDSYPIRDTNVRSRCEGVLRKSLTGGEPNNRRVSDAYSALFIYQWTLEQQDLYQRQRMMKMWDYLDKSNRQSARRVSLLSVRIVQVATIVDTPCDG